MATLKDVAEYTGLGLGTVSRALSGHPNVRPETRRKVEAAARELGYSSNVLARALRRNRSYSAGLILPDLENEFYTTAASVVQRVLRTEGYRLLVSCNNNSADVDQELLRSLMESRVDGIVHVPCTSEGADAVRALDPRIPVVEYARRSSARGVDSVIGDDERGAAEVVRHLVDLGHRSIAMITGPADLSTTVDRVRGFHDACARSGLPKRGCPILHGPSYDVEWGEAATDRVLERHPAVTAIFVAGARGALGALKALRNRNLSVPSDLSLVGFLGSGWLDVTDPPLTRYVLPLEDMSAMTARLLLDRIQHPRDGRRTEPNVMRFEGRLMVRESTAPPRTHELT
ncbi:LacI family DNA-binding transcriptional regulator [Amycolatopsis endophytica]|uniref:LacI family transcriptional regulator n=1 Tax=Amycolatopsis endophytica TaxID=860233 RepID=A0A853BE09_9PSEU|nr:LacI family DNA-binding transcriptional regulator [Amycolatopsis endophytica]NYI92984.1 LacI family transcriptional regulator [Amycolatopsis endophytica]